MSLSECRHRGVADSVGDDETDFGIGDLLDAAGQLRHRRIEFCLKLVAATAVEPVTGRTVFLVLRPGRPEIFCDRCKRICGGAYVAMDPPPQNVACYLLFDHARRIA